MKNITIIFNGLNSNQLNSRITSKGLNTYLKDIAQIQENVNALDIFKLNNIISKKLFFRLVKKLNFFDQFKYIKKVLSQTVDFSLYDKVFINGEGAIHHNRMTSLILIAYGLIAKEQGKKVILINFTIEEMDEKYLNMINQFDLIIPREGKSFDYLKPYIDKDKLIKSYDFAWYYLYSEYKNYMLSWREKNCNKNILFTKGVGLNSIEKYLKYDFLSLDDNDLKIAKQFKNYIHAEDLEDKQTKSIDEFLDYLLQYKLLVSGRHHTNIVAMFLGLPIMGLKSNTDKVSATMHDMLELKYKDNIPYNKINFVDYMEQEMIERIIENFEEVKRIINEI